MFWLIDYSFGQICQQKKRNKITAKVQALVAIILWIKELPKYRYQKEAVSFSFFAIPVAGICIRTPDYCESGLLVLN
jgi:hypothetical protein